MTVLLSLPVHDLPPNKDKRNKKTENITTSDHLMFYYYYYYLDQHNAVKDVWEHLYLRGSPRASKLWRAEGKAEGHEPL